MAYINSVVLLGNLCSDVELRYSSGKNEPIASFRLAVGKDRDVCYIQIVVFGNSATNCERYLTKGSGCAVEGVLAMSQWTDREGKNRTSYSVVAKKITFVGGGDRASRPTADGNQPQQQPRPSYAGHRYSRSDIPESMNQPQQTSQPEVPSSAGHIPPPEGGLDDIPF